MEFDNLVTKIFIALLIYLAPLSMGPILIISGNYLYIMVFICIFLFVLNFNKIISHKPVFNIKYTIISVLFALSFFTSMFFGADYKDLTDLTFYNSNFYPVLFNILLFVPLNFLLTYLIYISVENLESLYFYLKVFLTSSVFVTLISFLFGITYDEENRLGLTFDDPNYVGRFESFILIICITYFLFYKKKNILITTFIILNFVLSLAILLLSFSRAALLSFVIAFSIIILLTDSKILRISLIGINFLIFSYLIVFIAAQRGLSITENTTVFSSFLDMSNSTRVALNYASVLIFLDNPIFGIGYHNFYNIYINKEYVPDFIPVSLNVSVVHSWFFSTLAEQGLMGIITFCILVYFVFRNLLRIIKNPINEEYTFVSICMFGLFFIFIFNGLFFPVFFPEMMFPIIFGLSCGLIKIVKQQKNS